MMSVHSAVKRGMHWWGSVPCQGRLREGFGGVAKGEARRKIILIESAYSNSVPCFVASAVRSSDADERMQKGRRMLSQTGGAQS